MPFIGKSLTGSRRATLLIILALCSSAMAAQAKDAIREAKPVLWHNPGDISSKDLLNGPGGKADHPRLPVTFLEEDKGGHNSKFEVEDSAGTKWKAKLGIEAQPEIVATRLLWAVGYFTNQNYFVLDLEVQGLPAHLHRGQGHVTSPNHVEKVRLQRHLEGKKTGQWSWGDDRLKHTREYNGLRVMMALISNWDLKHENNAIYSDNNGNERFLVTDLGTAFGASGDRWTEAQSKNNLKAYESSKFITRETSTHVSFSFPRFPPFLYIFDLPHFVHQVRMRSVGNDVPREDAKWIGSLLAQLSAKQIQDAFEAGGYSAQDATAYTKAVRTRIAELTRL